MTEVIAPPADRPVTKILSPSIGNCAFIASIIPAIEAASPPPRLESLR